MEILAQSYVSPSNRIQVLHKSIIFHCNQINTLGTHFSKSNRQPPQQTSCQNLTQVISRTSKMSCLQLYWDKWTFWLFTSEMLFGLTCVRQKFTMILKNIFHSIVSYCLEWVKFKSLGWRAQWMNIISNFIYFHYSMEEYYFKFCLISYLEIYGHTLQLYY